MGVGVYSENWRGTGGTFLVPGTLALREDYEAYVEASEDPDDVLSYEAWSQSEADDEVDRLTFALANIPAAVADLKQPPVRDVESSALQTASDHYGVWRALAEVGPYVIGLRSWQHDYVVGIAPRSQDDGVEAFADDGSLDEMQVIDAYGAVIGIVREKAAELRDALLEYARLILQDEGFECRFRTSGYTTGRYEKLESASAATRLDVLRSEIEACKKWFDVDASDRLRSTAADAHERKLLLSALRMEQDAGGRIDRRGLWPVVPCVALESREGGAPVVVGRVHSALTGDLEFTCDLASSQHAVGGLLARLGAGGPVSLDLASEEERAVALQMVSTASRQWFVVEPADLLADFPDEVRDSWDLEAEGASLPAP